jgi:hypothetical protein
MAPDNDGCVFDRNFEQGSVLTKFPICLENCTDLFDSASIPGIVFLSRHGFSTDQMAWRHARRCRNCGKSETGFDCLEWYCPQDELQIAL